MNKLLIWAVFLVIFVSLWVVFSNSNINLAPKKTYKSIQNQFSGTITASDLFSIVQKTGSLGSSSKIAFKFARSL